MAAVSRTSVIEKPAGRNFTGWFNCALIASVSKRKHVGATKNPEKNPAVACEPVSL